jgi:hypothetical protein
MITDDIAIEYFGFQFGKRKLTFDVDVSRRDRLCGLVVKSSWLQIRRLGFDSRHYEKKSSGSGTGSTQPREYN